MARKHTDDLIKSKIEEPEDQSQEVEESENESQGPDESPANHDGRRRRTRKDGEFTNWEMVEAAMEAGHPTAKSGCPWIKEKFGVDMTSNLFSSTESINSGNRNSEVQYNSEKRESPPLVRKSEVKQKFELPDDFGNDMKKINNILRNFEDGNRLKDHLNEVGQLLDRYGIKALSSMIDAFDSNRKD